MNSNHCSAAAEKTHPMNTPTPASFVFPADFIATCDRFCLDPNKMALRLVTEFGVGLEVLTIIPSCAAPSPAASSRRQSQKRKL